MENCPNCGNKVSNIDVLCPRCGALVEVIKVNTNVPVKSSSSVMGSKSELDGLLQPPKKDYYQSFTVYSDDLPPEEIIDEPEAQPNDEQEVSLKAQPADTGDEIVSAKLNAEEETVPEKRLADALQEAASDAAPAQPDDAISLPEKRLADVLHEAASDAVPAQPDDVEFLPQTPQVDTSPSYEPIEPMQEEPKEEDDDIDFASIGVKYIQPIAPAVPDTDDFPLSQEDTEDAEDTKDTDDTSQPQKDSLYIDESTYSPEYLEAIRNIELPETDELEDFDPKAFMDEYRRDREAEAAAQAAAEAAEAAAKAAAEAAAAAANIAGQTEAAPPQADKSFLEIEEVETPTTMIDELYGDLDQEDETPETGQSGEAAMAQAAVPVQRYIVETNDEPDFLSEPSKKKIPILLAIFIWIVVAAAIFAGFYFLDGYITSNYGSYSEMFFEITGGKIDLDTQAEAPVSVNVEPSTTAAGDSAHLFSVSAVSGSSVRILPLDQTFSLEDGKANILISDYALAKSLGLSPNASPTVADGITFEVADDGETYTQTVGGLSLRLMPAEYILRQPLQKNNTTVEPFFILDVSVVSGAAITINTEDFSDKIDSSGSLNETISLDVFGDNVFDIVIAEPGKMAASITLTVHRQQPDTLLIPDHHYIRVYNDTFTCTGRTDAEASISAKADSNPPVTSQADADGLYAVTCLSDTYGLHTIILTASLEEQKDTTSTIYVELLPEVNAFSANAKKMSIDKILKDAEKLADTAVRVTGIVKGISSTDTEQLFTLYSDDGELPCYYHGLTQLSAEDEYTIYGMYDASQSKFYAMYVS